MTDSLSIDVHAFLMSFSVDETLFPRLVNFCPQVSENHTHTNTHTHTYIYIYRERERERERQTDRQRK